MSINLIDGVGSDLQVFGYDETPAPPAVRQAEREAAKAVWRRYRQNLYLDKDRQPFAVVEWLHTTTRIRILRVDSPLSETTCCCVTPPSQNLGDPAGRGKGNWNSTFRGNP
jgi:hypothetical protein